MSTFYLLLKSSYYDMVCHNFNVLSHNFEFSCQLWFTFFCKMMLHSTTLLIQCGYCNLLICVINIVIIELWDKSQNDSTLRHNVKIIIDKIKTFHLISYFRLSFISDLSLSISECQLYMSWWKLAQKLAPRALRCLYSVN